MHLRDETRPLRVINSLAPIRICDNGGWTDTWFAEHGKVFNIAVYPCAEVQLAVYPAAAREERIVIHAENYGQRYAVHPDAASWGPHPLLEAAIARMKVPRDVAIEVSVFCGVPAGASTGTSAAVTVALVGALSRLTPARPAPHEVAYSAHAVEVDMLQRQSGIQDQLCSAYGGVNYIEMFAYPQAAVSQLRPPEATWWELESRLALVYLGHAHDSSHVHQQVIAELEGAGPTCRQLEDLRSAAQASRDALCSGDLAGLGRAMVENTEAQARLHPALVSRDAARVIEIARGHGALGWKVNGAGGGGGSLTILGGARAGARRAMLRAIEQENRRFRHIPIHLSRHGLRVWEQGDDHGTP
ncbi:MAG TPA: GHMP kinase [Anaerolineae bacterium]|nr:GHMP kinase [Anaerolineae bacterium]HOQ99668.1 GHMP kinase [Anaerolineae bacterium]